ncbi:hypothetical protein GLOTRDRAFT_98131, partial [Gloeophyllum trabeum ATCC 11539]
MSKHTSGKSSSSGLTPSQKAAQTRAINRKRQEEQDAKELNKPTVPRDAKRKAAENRVWVQKKQPSQAPGRKRAGSVMAPATTNRTKKTKKDDHTLDKPETDAAAARTRSYKPAVITSDSEESNTPSNADDSNSNGEDYAEQEAEMIESDDERLMRMPAGPLADALEYEAPSFNDAAEYPSDDDYDIVLHAPPKMRRKSSASSFNSSTVSIPDVEDSDDEAPSAPRRTSMHSTKSSAHSIRTYDSVGSGKALVHGAPKAIDLFEDDDHVIGEGRQKAKGVITKGGDKNSSSALSSQTAYTVEGKLHKKVKSKREQDHEQEAPIWPRHHEDVDQKKLRLAHRKGLKAVTHRPGARDDDDIILVASDDADNSYDMTVLIYNERGKLNLTSQTQEIQAVARRGIDYIHVQIFTKHAYPDSGKRNEVALDACASAAEDLGPHYKPILDLLRDKTQVEFRKAVADIADGRISTIRRDVKSIASGHCVGHYGLRQDSATYVKNLLQAQRYIFEGDHR